MTRRKTIKMISGSNPSFSRASNIWASYVTPPLQTTQRWATRIVWATRPREMWATRRRPGAPAREMGHPRRSGPPRLRREKCVRSCRRRCPLVGYLQSNAIAVYAAESMSITSKPLLLGGIRACKREPAMKDKPVTTGFRKWNPSDTVKGTTQKTNIFATAFMS